MRRNKGRSRMKAHKVGRIWLFTSSHQEAPSHLITFELRPKCRVSVWRLIDAKAQGTARNFSAKVELEKKRQLYVFLQETLNSKHKV